MERIEDLKLYKEVKKLCDININIVNSSEALKYNLTEKSLANITENNTINILDTVSKEKQIEIIAHELGHIYLKENGLVCFEKNFEDELEFNYFILELNNAISHKHLIKILKEEFSISSNIHLKLRTICLNEIYNEIEDCEYSNMLLHGIGLKLYDISTTLPEKREQVERICSKNKEINKAYKLAQEYIGRIDLNMNKNEQITLINKYIEGLGYREEYYIND